MRRLLSILGAVPAVVCIALALVVFLGPSVYAEVAGAVAPGEVTAKREEISPKSESWSRQLTVDVRYRPAGADEDELARVAVDEATYDRARVEETVRLRYLPGDDLLRQAGNGFGARLETQPPLGPLSARLGPIMPYLVGVALWLVLLWAWSRWRRWWLAAGVAAVMAGGAFLAGSGWQRPLPPDERVAAGAVVREVTRIHRVWGGRRTPSEEAVQPFLVVELEFVPAGRADPVVAVDLVDEGSAPGLERGAELPIHYSAADPRRAQIDGASRTYVWKNLRSFGIIALLLLAVVGGGFALNRARQARRRPQP